MQGDVEKGEESEHAAKADEVREPQKLAKRRDRKGEDQETDRPIAGGVLQVLNGIRTKIALDDSPHQIAEGHQAENKNGHFGPFANQDCAHAEGPP